MQSTKNTNSERICPQCFRKRIIYMVAAATTGEW